MIRRARDSEEEIESVAALWLARRDAGLSAEQQSKFENWKSADVRHAAAVAEFESLWQAIGRPRRTGLALAVKQECGTLRRRRRRRQAGFAAGMLVVVLAVGLKLPDWSVQEPASISKRAVLLLPEQRALPDGSMVDLKRGATISVDFDAGGSGPRHVVLQSGEAHFQVARNENRPFVVTVGDVAVRALGTAFTIDRGSERVDVVVTEGTVQVERAGKTTVPAPLVTEEENPVALSSESATAAAQWVLSAGSRIVLPTGTNAGAPELRQVPETELGVRLAWRSPRVEFSRAPMNEVVKVVNRYNRVQFAIGDPELEDVVLSGLFRADDANAFARALELNFGVVAERVTASKIVLRRPR
jgi:transmembrane sensor